MSHINEMSLVCIESYDIWIHRLLQKLGLIESDDPSGGVVDYTVDDHLSEEYLLGLDPKDWKNQDHYRIFNIHNRFYATADDVKKQYRLKVLRHHPDKRTSATGLPIDLDLDYYSCITRAYEILGDPIKRRSYDSIDHTFDDEIP
ncbi:unnamed protein product, partial [Oppiella nova]